MWFYHRVHVICPKDAEGMANRVEQPQNCKQNYYGTVIFLSFRTDRSGQTVQTQIRLLLIGVYTVCNSLCIFWIHYSKEQSSCSTFRVITANFRVSEILGFLRYVDSELMLLAREIHTHAGDKHQHN